MKDAAFVDVLETIARKWQYADVLEQLESLHNITNEFLDVVVLGQFKAGKSSLINHLVGRELLPVGVLPVTAIITRLTYGNEDNVVVTFTNGKRKKITFPDLSQFVSEEENPVNKKQVLLVDIFLPAMKKFGNLRLIDTPGLGSIFKHNSELTQHWYHKIEVALVVISAAQPLSEQDMQIIRSSSEQSPEVFLLLSKIDLLDEKEQQKMIDFLSTKVQEAFGQVFPVFSYSVKKTSRQGKAQLQSELKSLSDRMGEKQNEILQHKLNYLAYRMNGYLDISKAAANKAANERKLLKEEIFTEQLNFSFIQKDLQYIMRHYLEETRKILEGQILEKELPPLILQLQKELEDQFPAWKGNLYRLARKYESWLKDRMKFGMMTIEEENKSVSNEILDRVLNHFNNYLRQFRDRLNKQIEEVLQVSLPEEYFELTAEPVKKPDISTSHAFDSHIDLLWFLVPLPVFRKMFLRSFKKQMPLEAEKNLRRLIARLTENLNRAIINKEMDLETTIRTRLENIENLLNTDHNAMDDLEADREQLSVFLDKV